MAKNKDKIIVDKIFQNGDDVEDVIESSLYFNRKPNLLLQVCCAPCFSGVIERLTKAFNITAYFYNPNLMPNSEFTKRYEALKRLVSYFPDVNILCPDQSVNDFLPMVKGLENEPEGGLRCTECFKLRLGKTAEYLSLNSEAFDYYTTTLTISPHKNAPLINEIGTLYGDKFGVKYLHSDFKKKDGFLRSIQLSKELGLYRQCYCGCGFSLNPKTK